MTSGLVIDAAGQGTIDSPEGMHVGYLLLARLLIICLLSSIAAVCSQVLVCSQLAYSKIMEPLSTCDSNGIMFSALQAFISHYILPHKLIADLALPSVACCCHATLQLCH